MLTLRRAMRFLAAAAFAAAALVGANASPAAAAEETSDRPTIGLRLVHITDGLGQAAPDDDPTRIGETKRAQEAAKLGLDLTKPPHPLLAHVRSSGRVWYAFYKVTENAFGDRPYLIQRIKKTERSWAAADTAKPDEKVTWQVEVFKTIGGTLKQPDEHYGDFGQHDTHRREIVKEYEIGFGEVPGVCEGRAWPFPANTLFRMLQPYGEDAGLHPKVAFTASRKWSLTVSLGKDGTYAIRSPELGIDVPKSLPDPALATAKPDAASKDVVLTPGAGPAGAKIGESTADDLKKLFGEPLEAAAAGQGHTNLSFRRSLTCNLDENGKLNTVITRPGFAGRVSNGLAHGMTRAQVVEKLGAPKEQRADAAQWGWPGVLVKFDGFDRVARIVVHKK